MKKLIIILLITVPLFLHGCNAAQPEHKAAGRTVSSIDLICKKASGTIYRHYSSPKKIAAVLHYMRSLSPNGPTKPPAETVQDDLYEITVHLHNGQMRTHRQLGFSYFALQGRPWGYIDSTLGMRLGHLMVLIPGDELDTNSTDIQEKHVNIS